MTQCDYCGDADQCDRGVHINRDGIANCKYCQVYATVYEGEEHFFVICGYDMPLLLSEIAIKAEVDV